jgi:hypothetical protein
VQRLALSAYGGGLVAALWPGELKDQAQALYGKQLGTKVVAAALERGWSAEGSPHLAFRNSPAGQRLYMKPEVGALEYSRRWEQDDLEKVGAHDRNSVRRSLALAQETWLRRR